MFKSTQNAPKSIQFLFLLSFLLIVQQVSSSGIFELNLSALTDAYGRDLRLECCAWQNASLDKQQQVLGVSNYLTQPLSSSSSSNQVSNGGRYAPTAAAQAESCDPTKCQLIIRICVKNYQTQIDPSQCTFGELSAQVMRPDEARHYSSHQHHPHASHMSSLNRLQQQQQLASFQKLRLSANGNSQPTNMHHHRMLMQQLQSPYMTMSPSSSEQHARLFHQGGQARSMRQIAFDQPINFPFNFTWPGAFSLVIDAWYESPTGLQQLTGAPFGSAPISYHPSRSIYQQAPGYPLAAPAAATSYDLYKKQLIIQHSMHGWLSVKNEWTSGMHKTDTAQLVYSYRVTCQPNYYGEQCNILCRPRDDVYGHFTCSEQGDVVCLAGWQGKYCEDPICTPGCHKDQGNCTRPNECNCRFGWQGAACEQCVRYPGCVHGTCSRPHECVCEEGWGGLLCNEDLRYCTNHQPCKNGATCKNRFDETGEGSYVCICDEGFTGKNCEKRVQDSQAMANQTSQAANSLLFAVQQTIGSASSSQSQPAGQAAQQMKPSPIASSNSNKLPSGKLAASVNQQQQQQPPPSVQQPSQHFPLPSGGFHSQPIPQPSTTAPASLDHRVMVAYGIIIVCMVILVVLLLLRVFFERLSGAVVGCGQRLVASGSNGTLWPNAMIAAAGHESERRRSSSRRHRHHRHHHHQSTRSLGLGIAGGEQDVATLQNHQNIYKSRSSLSTDKVPVFASSANETCSSASSSSSSVSSMAEDLANHHAASLQAQYSASAHYGGYGTLAAHHHLPPHHVAAHNPYASHLPPPPLHHPYHISAHSVHNLNSATYQRLNQHLGQQPPPPPYTISGNMSSSRGPGSSHQIYNSQSTTYAPASSIYATNYHPASLILGPPPSIANHNSIYSGNSTYGTAATIAAHCVSAGGYGLSQGAAASASTLPLESNESTPKKSKSASKLADEKQQNRSETSPASSQQQSASAAYAAAQAAAASTNHYGNLQPASGDAVESHESQQTGPDQESQSQLQSQSQTQTSQQDQSPYYFFMCSHDQ